MKRLLIFAVVLVAFLGGAMVALRYSRSQEAEAMARQQAAWEAERAELIAAANRARDAAVSSPAAATAVVARPTPTVAAAPTALSPEELMTRLVALRGQKSAAAYRQAVWLLEELAGKGAAALPVIRGWLARYEDFELDTSSLQGRAARERVPLETVVPVSLRMGLFGVVRRIGGPEAETILAEALAKTGRGLEVAWLVAALQESAPDKFRDQALAVAHTLLAQPSPAATSPLDANHRDYLFGVLALFKDASFAGTAQTQIVKADSQVDRGALRYLQQVLGPQAVPIAAQAWQNPALTNASAREPLARVALAFAGADAQANEFYQQAINDPALTKSHRKNLIEDLNQDGFADLKNLGARDLPLIENRLRLIEQLAPAAIDDVNAAAFKEAYKDLQGMRERIVGTK